MTTLTAPTTAADTTSIAPDLGLESPDVATASLRQPWSRRGALFLLRAYQSAASGRVSSCRYYPSCSNYAMEAFSLHRFWRAFGLTARRLVRCRPFGPHGIDLVPLPETSSFDGGAQPHDHRHHHAAMAEQRPDQAGCEVHAP